MCFLMTLTTGFAGTPDQDPLVAEVRSQFKQASSIVAEEGLQLGKRWICSTFDAKFDSYTHSKRPVELGYFELFADNIIKLKLGIEDDIKEESYVFLSDNKLDHRYKKESSFSDITSNGFKQIRMNVNGDLIIESGFDRGKPKPYSDESDFIPAISHSGHKVMTYSICLLKDTI
jgi:hypothetical protein